MLKLIEQQPFEPQTLILSANIYTQNTEYLAALDVLEAINSQVQDSYFLAEIKQLILNIVQLYLNQLSEGKADEKLNFLYRIIDLLPNHPTFRYQLSKLLLMLEKYDEVIFQLDYLATNPQWKKQFKRLKNALNYAQTFTQGELSISLIYQSGAWYIKAKINNKKAVLLLDTGASIILISAHILSS